MNPMPTARHGLTGVSVGGRLYASGGVDFARHAVATVRSCKEDSCGVHSGVHGMSSPASVPVESADPAKAKVELYDPEDGTWEPVPGARLFVLVPFLISLPGFSMPISEGQISVVPTPFRVCPTLPLTNSQGRCFLQCFVGGMFQPF